MNDLFHNAEATGTGICAFNVVHLEHAEAFVSAAERVGTPCVLQISENTVTYHGGLEPIGLAMLSMANAASVPMSVQLDHATQIGLCIQAAELGFPAVMFDGSRLAYEENVEATREVGRALGPIGVWIESEVGEIGGKDGVHHPEARTDVNQAVVFTATTHVDALAVAIGTSHGMTSRSAALDLSLARELRSALRVPLVLHGSSGVADEDLVSAVTAGFRKINLATRFNIAFSKEIRAVLSDDVHLVDSRKYVGAGRDAVEAEARRLLDLVSRSDIERSSPRRDIAT